MVNLIKEDLLGKRLNLYELDNMLWIEFCAKRIESNIIDIEEPAFSYQLFKKNDYEEMVEYIILIEFKIINIDTNDIEFIKNTFVEIENIKEI